MNQTDITWNFPGRDLPNEWTHHRKLWQRTEKKHSRNGAGSRALELSWAVWHKLTNVQNVEAQWAERCVATCINGQRPCFWPVAPAATSHLLDFSENDICSKESMSWVWNATHFTILCSIYAGWLMPLSERATHPILTTRQPFYVNGNLNNKYTNL